MRSGGHLVDPVAVGAPPVSGLPAVLPPKPPDTLPGVRDNGEPLVPVPDGVGEVPIYWRERWPGASRTLLVRSGVRERLVAAAGALPPGFGLVVLDAWRSDVLQRALFEHYYDRSSLAPGFVSDPDDESRIPPHATGGAVDVTLSWDGHPLALGTDFDSFDGRARPDALEPDGEEPSRSLRRLLNQVLSEARFVVYPLEWWHFSYGDQLWAAHHAELALYDRASPGALEVDESR